MIGFSTAQEQWHTLGVPAYLWINA